MKNDLVVIVGGPTASGKTSFAINLAKKINGELINADSRQIYIGLDIGTNKGVYKKNKESLNINNHEIFSFELENSSINCWLLNFLNPNESFSVGDFKEYTYKIIEYIKSKNKVPIIVGGTGLYIDSIIKNYELTSTKPNEELREELSKLTKTELFDALLKLNKDLALSLNNSDKNNPHRLIRLIEKEQFKGTNIEQKANLTTLLFYPKYLKEDLFNKIDERVVEMINEGMIEETISAIQNGFEDSKILNGIGYVSVKKYLNKKITKDEMVKEIQLDHRKYAKRQITWFEGENRKYDLIKIGFKKDIDESVKLYNSRSIC